MIPQDLTPQNHLAQLVPTSATTEDIDIFTRQNRGKRVLIFLEKGSVESGIMLYVGERIDGTRSVRWDDDRGTTCRSRLHEVRLIREGSAPANPTE